MEQRLQHLERTVDELITRGTPAEESEKRAIVALAKEIRLANNYTLTENLEKLGHSELASYDLFRKEKAQAKRYRQRLIEKLHILMGNGAEPEDDAFCRNNDLHQVVQVEVEGLPARAFNVPLNQIRRPEGSVDIEDLDSLLAQELKSARDVEGNPLALAMLGVGEGVSGEGGALLKLVSKAPASILAEWSESGDALKELQNVQVRDLKELFFEYLSSHGAVVSEAVDRDKFVEMQINQGLADILLKESCNEHDLVRFLNERGQRGVDRELLTEAFEQFATIDQEQDLEYRKQLQVVYEDLLNLVARARAGRFEVPFRVMKQVLYSFESLAKPYMELERLEKESKTSAEDMERIVDDKVLEMAKQDRRDTTGSKLAFTDEEQPPAMRVRVDDFEQVTVVQTVIKHEGDGSLYVEPSDQEEGDSDVEPEPEERFEKEEIDWDESRPDLMDEEKGFEQVPVWDLEQERRKRVERTGVSKSMLEDIFSKGAFYGVSLEHQEHIFNALEVQKLARDTSSSRMKQYLLMYKVAETPLEQEFCLQRMRKELVSYGRYDTDILAKGDRFSHFELFVDALARQMEAQVETTEFARTGQVVAQILDREYLPHTARAAFKAFVEERVGTGASGDKAVQMEAKEKESDNLQMSTAKLAELARGVNIGGFLSKVEMAMTGNWEHRGRRR